MNKNTSHLPKLLRSIIGLVDDPFSRDIAGLSQATGTQLVELRNGDTFDLQSGAVRKRIGDAEVKMLAYR